MKQILLAFVLLLVSMPQVRGEIARAADSSTENKTENKMVVEGRTWWYSTETSYLIASALSYGLSIGKEVILDGEPWHEVNFVRGFEANREATEPEKKWIINDDTTCVAYIKEVNNDVYVYLTESNLSKKGYIYDEATFNYYSCVNQYQDNKNGRTLLFHFGEVGDEYVFGNEDYTPRIRIKDQYIESNSGYDYVVSEMEYVDYPDSDDTYYGFFNGMKQVEGIGLVSLQYPLGELFIAPGREPTATYPQRDPHRLEYVTDADQNIIYEGLGRDKLWLRPLGIADVVADQEAPDTYYNLQGVEVKGDLSPGLYIRRQGANATKIVVK